MKRSAIGFAILLSGTVAAVFAQAVSMEKVPVTVSTPGEGGEAAAVTAAAPEKSGAEVIRFISGFASPPFSFKEGMKKTGLEIDLAEALAAELGRKVEWIDKNFNITTYTSALDSGTADAAIASITVTPEREKKLDFTTPYFVTSLAVAARDDVDWKKSEFETGLKDWVVGVMRGTTGEEWARKNIKGEIRTFASTDRLIAKLADTKFEKRFCIITDEPLLVGSAEREGYKFKIVEKAFSRQRYAIAVKKGNTKLLEELNGAFEKIHSNGVYDRIFHKWYEKASDLPLAGKYE